MKLKELLISLAEERGFKFADNDILWADLVSGLPTKMELTPEQEAFFRRTVPPIIDEVAAMTPKQLQKEMTKLLGSN